MNWTPVADSAELEAKGSMIVRVEGRQIALFKEDDVIFAVDNRCPHEGYPLQQGTLDAKRCQLTCQWHNWKFDVRTGKALVGQDSVKAYQVRILDGRVALDLSEPDPEEREREIYGGLWVGFARRQYGRMVRDVARLVSEGFDAEKAVREAMRRCHDRVEYGVHHGWAAAADWLTLYDASRDDEQRVICIVEILDQFAENALGEPVYPYTTARRAYAAEDLAHALEAEDEDSAIALVHGALDQGLGWQDLEPVLVRAAMAHYYDFGHTLIYIQKIGELARRFGDESLIYLLPPLIRSICFATREDKIPEFRRYAEQIADRPAGFGTGHRIDEPAALAGISLDQAFTELRMRVPRLSAMALAELLMAACARNMTRYDLSHDRSVAFGVAESGNWLELTHALTFAHALRTFLPKYPEIAWPGLVQLACFLGRNKKFLGKTDHHDEWRVWDRSGFWDDVLARITDHGQARTIHSCHYLKTSFAVRAELDSIGEQSAEALLAALNRFLHEPIKAKQVRRTARQALDLVSPRGASRSNRRHR